MRILELVTGTGNLASRFFRQGCILYGLDFSAEMLAIARQKIPVAHLIQADLLSGWPFDPQFKNLCNPYQILFLQAHSKNGIFPETKR